MSEEIPVHSEELDAILEMELRAKKEELRRIKERPDFDEFEEEIETPPQAESIHVSEYINLPPRLTDISFQRSGELIDLKILKENIYLKAKRTYIIGLLMGVIIFVLGVI